jgi:hypothetical protein
MDPGPWGRVSEVGAVGGVKDQMDEMGWDEHAGTLYGLNPAFFH